MAEQNAVKRLWLEGVEGRLCGREQAKAWALREVWIDDGKTHGRHPPLRRLHRRHGKTWVAGIPRFAACTAGTVKRGLQASPSSPLAPQAR